MAILAFQRPDKVIMLESDDRHGKFEFRPLEPGYGMTIGNALRRILLSSLEGYAITHIKIEGVQHEFSTIEGVVEDVTEIVLNLKQIRFKKLQGAEDSEKVTLAIKGQTQIKAGDLSKVLVGFDVLNPELVICNLDPKIRFSMEVSIGKGRGYVMSDENRATLEEQNREGVPIGVIAIDSIYTPIKNVKYAVENYRVEQKTDYEKLTIDIDTDGSILPKDALTEAAKILIYHFMLFSDERIVLEEEIKQPTESYNEETAKMRQLLKTRLVDMELSVRALNCLKNAEVETLGELVKFTKNDLLKFRNFGKKSLTELEEVLESLNLAFGMDVSKYKLDRD